MTTTPDPKVVREISREAIRSASQRLELIDAVIARQRAIGDRPASGSGELGAWHAVYSAFCKAVRADMQAALWADEQPQNERDGIREQIALDLERTSNALDQDAERYADERSPLLQAQAEALWEAARRIRGGAALDAHDANGGE